MKKTIFKTLLAAAFTMVVGYNVHMSQQNIEMSDLAMANVEALASNESWIEDWWNSKVYSCQSVQVWTYKCMRYGDIPREDGGWEIGGNFAPDDIVCGYFKDWDTDCVSGSTVAHCWDC